MSRAWHIVEPNTQYVNNWHIDIISEYLGAAARGEVRNLIINIPPRCMKSLLACVFFPTWVWTWAPHTRWLFGSYSADLALRDAVKSLHIIASSWYQERFGDVFSLTKGAAGRYENNERGFRVSVGVGGSATGEGGDFLVADDAVKALEGDSDAVRETANSWWGQTMSTRGNDPKKVVKIIIMQRLHESDLTGYVLDQAKVAGAEQYEHLCLPMEHEPQRFVSSIGLEDPRKEPGELLWSERFGQKEVNGLKAALGERGAAGQLQQRPAPAGGAIYKGAWWDGKNRFDPGDRLFSRLVVGRWLSFDTALKDEEQNDYTGMTVFELTPEYYLALRRVEWRKLQFPQLSKEIEDQAIRWNHDGKLRGVIIEDKASGTSAIQTLMQSAPEEISKLIIPFLPTGSKEYRARQASLWCERDCILFPKPHRSTEWLIDFEDMLLKFPGARIDDPVDAFTQGIIYLEHLLAEGWQARTGYIL